MFINIPVHDAIVKPFLSISIVKPFQVLKSLTLFENNKITTMKHNIDARDRFNRQGTLINNKNIIIKKLGAHKKITKKMYNI